MDGDDTYAAAIEDAKARVGVDVGTLYNVFVDRRIVCFPFCSFAIVTNVTTSIYGTLVTYDGLKNVEPKLYSLDAMKRGEKICVVTNKGENITGTFAYVDYSLPKKLWLNTGTHTYYFGETAIGLDSIASVEEDTGDCGKTKVKEPI